MSPFGGTANNLKASEIWQGGATTRHDFFVSGHKPKRLRTSGLMFNNAL